MYADVIVTADHVETLAEESPDPQTDGALDPQATANGPVPATANAIAIRDGRILAIGTAPDLEPVRGPGTVVHAFPGATILPGLTDVHAHPVWGSIEIGSGVDLSGASTLDQVFSCLADAAQGRPHGRLDHRLRPRRQRLRRRPHRHRARRPVPRLYRSR